MGFANTLSSLRKVFFSWDMAETELFAVASPMMLD
jgi:hypothetical protein